MTERESKRLIKDTFEQNFNKERFQRFIANVLTDFQEASTVVTEQYIKDAYNPYVESYEIIAKYTDVNNRNIDVLIVDLKKESSFTARTRQRNFALDYIKTRNKDAVLVAYVHPNGEDWRFSFVKLETDIAKTDEGKVVDVEEFTSAKRSSFLVGEHENSYTAKKQLLPIIVSEEPPRFEEIEEAFSVEKVTKEFFEKYKELFHRVNEALIKEIEAKPSLKEEFDKKEISTVDFSKKLLGQMVFLYFLQKKGWFGVDAKEEWGTGPKNFIRELFRRREKYGENFFNDVLEPLFYEALAQDRGQDSIYPRLNNCRMPFLNGGLFEPMRGYSWEITDILLPDKLFSNENKTKEGDTGDGILDVFDRYNFTVNESDPLEKEVAVDPEMLGKVFENLLDVKDRKSSGSYYTPREIVHYMCQECLINYLETETKGDIPREDIEYVVLNGETIIQNDLVTLEKQREKEEKGYKYTGTYELKLPESIRKNARRIDELLKEIKVCDPAVGSGAFPLGMINEITGVRQVLQVYLRDGLLNYDLKYHAIANSIHGVDLDPGAVEIARLRLWLSLVVEEKNPRPLPNLEHRVMQGNSLLSEYEGIQLFNKDLLAGGDDDEAVQFEMIYDSGIKGKIEELERNIKLYVDTSQRSQKQRIKENIDELRWELIEDTLKEQGKLDKVEEVKSLRDRNVRPFFIWELEFSEVFKEKGGFDVVIGNPPYVGEKGHKEIFRELKKGNMGKYYQGKMDLFYFFFHLALNLGNHTSKIAFITTNYYVTASGGKKLRTDLKKRSIVERLINFNELKIFETARGQHNMITILCKGHDPEQIANTCITERTGNANSEILNKIISWTDPKTKYYKIKQKDLYTGSQNYIRFESLNGGNNLLGSALNKMQSQGTLLGEICNVNQGIVTGADKVSNRHLKKYNWKEEKGTGIFVLNDEEVETLNTKKYFKKWFKNSDIRKYYTNVDTSENILYLNDNFEGEQDILSHLSRFKENLLERREVHSGSRKWHDLWRGRDPEIFESPKIVAPQRSNTNTFGYSENAWYASADVYFITSKPNTKVRLKYILALLNSKLFYQWLYHKGKRKGETLELYQTPLSEIPIKIIEEKEQQLFITMVDKILDLTSGENYDPHNPPEIQKELEEQIDQMVYKLYGLTKEEIEDVEETIPS